MRATDVVVAGGGVAGLEGLLALRDLADDRIDLTLVAPDQDFTYRPLAVAEPFALGHAYRVPLSQFAQHAGAELVTDATLAVNDQAGELRLRDAAHARSTRCSSPPAPAQCSASRAPRRGGQAAIPRSTAACSATWTRATPSAS